jgi:hypothetical protein
MDFARSHQRGWHNLLLTWVHHQVDFRCSSTFQGQVFWFNFKVQFCTAFWLWFHTFQLSGIFIFQGKYLKKWASVEDILNLHKMCIYIKVCYKLKWGTPKLSIYRFIFQYKPSILGYNTHVLEVVDMWIVLPSEDVRSPRSSQIFWPNQCHC